jgi:hypothetical protein
VSHDLLVATRTRPAPAAVEEFARSAGLRLRVTGAFRTGSNALLTRIDGTVERTIDVDGPVRVESDDLPDDLAGVVARPAWLVEIHLPGGYDETADRWALDLAIHLARAGDGAVFDPQADRLAWPSGVTPRPRDTTEERIRTLELVWYVPARALPLDAPERWIALVAERFPAAAPTRFGAFEPFGGRLDRDGPAAFARAWREQAAVEFGGMLFWSARAPFLDGSVSFPDGRPDRRPARLGRVVRLSTTLDARPLHRDPDVCDAVVRLFADVAEDLGAVYGAGCVLRDAIMRRGRVFYDAMSENVPMPRSRWWVGLPALPTWLGWFGGPYRGLLEGRLDATTVSGRSSGLLLRSGPEPMDVDQLRGVALELPAELRAVRPPGSTVDPAVRITMTLGPPSGPAETIPFID